MGHTEKDSCVHVYYRCTEATLRILLHRVIFAHVEHQSSCNNTLKVPYTLLNCRVVNSCPHAAIQFHYCWLHIRCLHGEMYCWQTMIFLCCIKDVTSWLTSVCSFAGWSQGLLHTAIIRNERYLCLRKSCLFHLQLWLQKLEVFRPSFGLWVTCLHP